MNLDKKIDELLESKSYVIDILPYRLSNERFENFSKFEHYFSHKENKIKIYEKFLMFLLKLNCYFDFNINIDNKWVLIPKLDDFEKMIFNCIKFNNNYISIVIEEINVMIIVNSDDLYMSVYNLTNQNYDLFDELVKSEGLFLRRTDC